MKNEIKTIKCIKTLFAIVWIAILIFSVVLLLKEKAHYILIIINFVSGVAIIALLQILQNASTRIEALSILLCDKKTITEQELNNMQTNIDMHLTAKAKEEIKSTTVCINCGATIAKDIDKCPFCDKRIKALPNSNQNTE